MSLSKCWRVSANVLGVDPFAWGSLSMLYLSCDGAQSFIGKAILALFQLVPHESGVDFVPQLISPCDVVSLFISAAAARDDGKVTCLPYEAACSFGDVINYFYDSLDPRHISTHPMVGNLTEEQLNSPLRTLPNELVASSACHRVFHGSGFWRGAGAPEYFRLAMSSLPPQLWSTTALELFLKFSVVCTALTDGYVRAAGIRLHVESLFPRERFGRSKLEPPSMASFYGEYYRSLSESVGVSPLFEAFYSCEKGDSCSVLHSFRVFGTPSDPEFSELWYSVWGRDNK